VSPRLLVTLGSLLALQSTNVSKQVAALATQRDPARLEAAAVSVAASGDAAAIGKLATQLGTASFLRRLDPPPRGKKPEVQPENERLGHVFLALGEHPSASTEQLCVAVARNPAFTAAPGRLNLLLNALAAVRPTSKEAAAIFRETSHAGYFSVNGPLLARNADPLALALLEELMADDQLDTQERIDVAHRSLLPVRTNAAVVAMAAHAAISGAIAAPVRLAIAETLFDYQPKPWFGVAMNQPTPPPWSVADPATRKTLHALGEQLLGRSEVPAQLRAAIQATLAQLK